MHALPREGPGPEVILDGVGIDIASVPDGSITVSQYRRLKANTAGWNALVSKLNNEALAEMTRNRLRRYGHAPYPVQRHDELYELLVPELLKRLE
jgi:hypothetical protein